MRVLKMLWREKNAALVKWIAKQARTIAETLDPEPAKIVGVLRHDKKAGEFLTQDDWLTQGMIRVTSGASIFSEERPA